MHHLSAANPFDGLKVIMSMDASGSSVAVSSSSSSSRLEDQTENIRSPVYNHVRMLMEEKHMKECGSNKNGKSTNSNSSHNNNGVGGICGEMEAVDNKEMQKLVCGIVLVVSIVLLPWFLVMFHMSGGVEKALIL
jgi:hypothetical protein